MFLEIVIARDFISVTELMLAPIPKPSTTRGRYALNHSRLLGSTYSRFAAGLV